MYIFTHKAFLASIKLTNKFTVFFISNMEALNYNKLFKLSTIDLVDFDFIKSIINILDLLTLLKLLEFYLN